MECVEGNKAAPNRPRAVGCNFSGFNMFETGGIDYIAFERHLDIVIALLLFFAFFGEQANQVMSVVVRSNTLVGIGR